MRYSISIAGLIGLGMAGCADTTQVPAELDLTAEPDGGEADAGDHDDETPPPTIDAGPLSFVQDCDDREVTVDARVSLDGIPSSDVQCTFEFDDGEVFSGCQGTVEFDVPGLKDVTLTVRHPASGAERVFTSTEIVYDPFTLDIDVDVPACGLTFSVTPRFAPDVDMLVVLVSPDDQVTPLPSEGGVYQFGAAAEGTFQLLVHAEDERIGPICSRTIERDITLVACEDEHEHTPTCDHVP